ncbi:hypothetical protein ACHAP5_008239 [Fusarium lateritium]
MSAIDAYFFGASASTESGLNTIDVRDLKTYQQLYIYFIPILTNLGFINIIVVIVRLHWFKRHLKHLTPQVLKHQRASDAHPDIEDTYDESKITGDISGKSIGESTGNIVGTDSGKTDHYTEANEERQITRPTTITFDPSTELNKDNATLYIPGPQARDRGHPITAKNHDGYQESDDDDRIKPVTRVNTGNSSMRRRRRLSNDDSLQITAAKSIDRVAGVAASIMLLGSQTTPRPRSMVSTTKEQPALNDSPFLSRQATLGRNSQFKNLTSHDREVLGGIEYRTLKFLLKIVTGEHASRLG